MRFFGHPILGSEEITSFMAILMMAGAMPYTHYEKGHIGVNLIIRKFSKKILDLVGPQKIRFEDFVKLFTKNTSVKIKKINLESAYDEAKRNPRSVYGLESLNILVGDYTSDGKQLKKLSDVKLTTVREFLQTSRLS